MVLKMFKYYFFLFCQILPPEIPGNLSTSDYHYPEIEKSPGNDTRKFSTSGHHFLEAEKSTGNDSWRFLNRGV